MNLQSLTEAYLPAVIGHYEHLHAHPELSFREKHTAEYIEQQLRQTGLEVHRLPANAVLGLLRAERPDKTIGLRAEMDALPLYENTGVSYASQNEGVMHACGHDLHAAAALGVAKILNELKAEIPHNILFIFQHAEEKIPGGAKDVIQSDFFREHRPDMMIALHVFPELKAGEAGFLPGAYMASSDEIDIHIKGPGGHAAMPHKTVDTITAAAHVLIALQQISARFIPADVPSVLSFGNIKTNSVMNIIPKQVVLEGTFRIMNENWRTKALKKIEKVARLTANTMNADAETVIRKGFPAINNDEYITQNLRKIAEEILGKNNVHTLPVRMTADDFGYYAQVIPSVYFRLGVADSKGQCAGLHTPEFLPDKKALPTALRLLNNLIIKL